MKRLVENLFEFEQSQSTGTKIYLRFFELFIVFNTLVYAWRWGLYILKISEAVLPLGIGQYIDPEIFYQNNFGLYNAIFVSVFTVTAFLLKKAKWLYALSFVLMHLMFVARFSQGEIPHSQALLGYSLLGLAIGSCVFKQKDPSLRFAFGFVVFFIGLGYTTAGLSKLVATGFHWVDGRHLWLWIAEKSVDVLSHYGTYQRNFLQELVLDYRWMGTAFLTVGLMTELSGVLVWWKKFRYFEFFMIIGLHAGIYVLMNILFFYYTIELFIIGFPWYKLLNKYIDESKINRDSPVYRFLLY